MTQEQNIRYYCSHKRINCDSIESAVEQAVAYIKRINKNPGYHWPDLQYINIDQIRPPEPTDIDFNIDDFLEETLNRAQKIMADDEMLAHDIACPNLNYNLNDPVLIKIKETLESYIFDNTDVYGCAWVKTNNILRVWECGKYELIIRPQTSADPVQLCIGQSA
jgi:hypothetical protein